MKGGTAGTTKQNANRKKINRLAFFIFKPCPQPCPQIDFSSVIGIMEALRDEKFFIFVKFF